MGSDTNSSRTGIQTGAVDLPHGIRLTWRGLAATADRPRVMLLHGFPEAAFAWDEVLQRLDGRVQAVAPNLRGFADSSSPADVEAYRARHLVADLRAFIGHWGAPLDLLVAHDWGGALAWNVAAQHPELIKRLLIINAPHPAAFLRELLSSPAQQAASAYMHFLCRPDAQALLAEDDFRRLWTFFTNMGAVDPAQPGGGWLTPACRARYREVWQAGLNPALNYYRASPLKPPSGPDSPIHRVVFRPQDVTVNVPVTVLWGLADTALPEGLLDGLSAWVPDLELIRVPGASHWIVHERPEQVAELIAQRAGAAAAEPAPQ